MDNLLVKAILPRRVSFNDKAYDLRPPTVREAVLLLSAAKEALQGDEDSLNLVFLVLQDWYPPSLMAATRAADPREVILYALTIAQEGTPAVRAKPEQTASAGASMRWEEIVGEYMRAYGQSLEATLSEPWPGFLLLALQIARLKSREKLDTLHVKAVQYAKRNRQKEMIESLQALAGITVKPKKIDPKEAEKNMKAIEAMFAQSSHLGRA